jgi:hypothetical protein
MIQYMPFFGNVFFHEKAKSTALRPKGEKVPCSSYLEF